MTKTHTKPRKRIALVGRLAIFAGSIVAITGFTMSPAAADRPDGGDDDHRIEICHGTSAQEQNPYTTPTPFKWQIVAPNGHDTHDGDENSYPDIVPPFEAGSKGNHSWDAYAGKNWTTEVDDLGLTGQQIWEQGCTTDPIPAGSISLDKATAGDGQPVDTTAFAFTVSCDGEATVPNAAPSVAPVDPALEVVSAASGEETCTITETGAAGAASTTYSINGGPEQSGSSAVVTFENSNQTFSVVFTNTYACPAGQVPNGEGGCGVDACPNVPDFQDNAAEDCPVIVNDACPLVAGVQASASECPTQVVGEVVTNTPAGPVTEVKGATVAAAELPRTGKASLPLAELGLGLLLMGAGALIFARDEAATA